MTTAAGRLPAGDSKTDERSGAATIRLIPGGSLGAARTQIGVNAFDRDDLPSGGTQRAWTG